MPIHDWTRVDEGLFQSFRLHWISSLCDALNSRGLPSDYFALIERPTPRPILDILDLELPRSPGPPSIRSQARAVTEDPPKARVVRSTESGVYARKADRVTVRHRHGTVVAVIEIVSPGNKGSRSEIRAFVEKVADLIQRGIHALIVDVFPPTPRDPRGIHKAIWDEFEEEDFTPPPDKPLTVAAYSAGPIKTAYVEPIGVGDELPDMPLFLEPESYVPSPLEAAYRTAWDVFPAALKGLLEPDRGR